MFQFANLIDALNAAPPDRLFITHWIDEDERESVTFGEFRERARQEAALLRKHGLEAGDRAVILMPQGIAGMSTFVAAMMLGAVPAFLAYPNFKVDASKCRSGLLGVTANLHAKAVIIDQGFPDEFLDCIALGDLTRVLRAGTGLGRGPVDLPMANIQPDSLAFIQHSAGTTGLQKGVALTHAAVLRQLGYLAQSLKIDGATDSIYSWLPLYHDMGLIACFMLPMVCHVPVVMQSPLDWVMQPEAMLQVVSEYKCTLGWMPNFAFQFVPRRTSKQRWHDYDLSSLRALINCSEPVRSSSMNEFQAAFKTKPAVMQSSYAMAENVFAVTQSDMGQAAKAVWADAKEFRNSHRIAIVPEGTAGSLSFTSSGHALPGHEIKIVSDSGAPLPAASVGEILVKSDCLFSGYYNRPDLTAEALVDGWYRTGDLGFLLEDELFVIGRKKDLLIVGGENIYPQDIEEIVGQHSAIHEGRVIAAGIYNPDLGTEDIVVVAEVEGCELLNDASKIEQEIRALVVGSMGVTVKTVLLKPPKWIIKSTAGKAARSATRDKLLKEHPELGSEAEGDRA